MIRFLPYAFSGLLVAALWFLWSDRAAMVDEIADLKREVRVQTVVAELAATARDVARAEVKRHRAKAEEYDALKEALLRGQHDAPIPDWLRAYLDSLFSI